MVVDTNSTDLDLHYLQRQGISEFSRTTVKKKKKKKNNSYFYVKTYVVGTH